MRVYIAAPYGARDQVRRYANELTRIGIEVTCRWLDETHDINDGTTGPATDVEDAQIAEHANDDLLDIEISDVLVLLTESVVELTGGTATSGGRHVETGFFLAKRGGLGLIVVGQPENIFHRLGGVTVVPDWHEAVLELAARQAGYVEAPRRLCEPAVPG